MPNYAICRVFTEASTPSLYDPHISFMRRSTGTAFFINHNDRLTILTNAHVINAGKLIRLEMIEAEGAKIHSCYATIKRSFDSFDVAVLELSDKKEKVDIFLEYAKRFALTMYPGNASLETLKEAKIQVIGYQRSNSAAEISQTNGNMTRFIETTYAQSNQTYPVICLTNRINPGFSGSPVIIELDKKPYIFGIIHQSPAKADGEHNAIPWFMIKPLLQAIEQDRLLDFRGPVATAFNYQNLMNSYEAKILGVPEGKGIRITTIPSTSILPKLGIKTGDVIIAINGLDIDNIGTVYDKTLQCKISYWQYIYQLPQNSCVDLTICRFEKNLNKKTQFRVNVPLVQTDSDAQLIKMGAQKTFFAGGMVFYTQNRGLLAAYSNDPNSAAYVRGLLNKTVTDKHHESVFIADIHTTELTEHYSNYHGYWVSEIDNQPVRDIYHLAELINKSRLSGSEFFEVRAKFNITANFILKHHTLEEEEAIGKKYNLAVKNLSNLISPNKLKSSSELLIKFMRLQKISSQPNEQGGDEKEHKDTSLSSKIINKAKLMTEAEKQEWQAISRKHRAQFAWRNLTGYAAKNIEVKKTEAPEPSAAFAQKNKQ